MNTRSLRLLLLAGTVLLTGCEKASFDRVLGIAKPTPEPTPVASAAATPKSGSWMWDKNRRTLLDQTPKKR